MEENKITVLKETSQNKISKKRHIFLDLGTNNGDSVKFFVDKAEKSSDGYKVLQGYGALDNKKWEIYAIEANPYFNKILTDVKVYCENLGHKFNLLTETAAWTKNEKLVFYLDTVNVNVNFWGSSLIKNHPDVVSSGYKNVTVNGIDISEILKKYNSDDEIVMKIDIEGAEYDLLLHLIKEGSLHLVDLIAVEYHQRMLKDNLFSFHELEIFFTDYFRFFNVRTVPWF
jgi:FkbM family methyltransferase